MGFRGRLESLAHLVKEPRLFLKKAGQQAGVLGCPIPATALLKPHAPLRRAQRADQACGIAHVGTHLTSTCPSECLLKAALGLFVLCAPGEGLPPVRGPERHELLKGLLRAHRGPFIRPWLPGGEAAKGQGLPWTLPKEDT